MIVTPNRRYDRFVDDAAANRIRFTKAAGVKTRVCEDGDGTPLVLIHGGDFGSLYSLDAWDLNVPGLAKSFRVVSFDKLGQGMSEGPQDDADFTFERLQAHAVALLDSLELGPAHVVGHSMGALLAARIALDRPDLLRTLVVVDSNTLAPDDERFPRGAFYRDLERRIPPGPPTRDSVRLEPDRQSTSTAHVDDHFVDRLLELAQMPGNVETHARMKKLRYACWFPSLDAVRERTLREIADGGIPAPTLVVWGADDPSAPLPLGLALFAHLAGGGTDVAFHVFGAAGHYCFRERPAAFNRLVESFCMEAG
jgi:2-hydroxy-6-oxonona-2,4-dienedioate hydrolase